MKNNNDFKHRNTVQFQYIHFNINIDNKTQNTCYKDTVSRTQTQSPVTIRQLTDSFIIDNGIPDIQW